MERCLVVLRSNSGKHWSSKLLPEFKLLSTQGDLASDNFFGRLLFAGVLLIAGLAGAPCLCQDSVVATENTTTLELQTPTGVLHASLDLPAKESKPVPVILVHPGSGPTDADGNSLLTKNDSLKLLGAALSKAGFAVCRIDKRGVGRSTAAGVKESELRFDTYVSDAVAWIKLLKFDNRFSDVHVIGHSEGSLIGILAAQKVEVASLVSIAGTGVAAGDLLRRQLTAQIPPATMKSVESILKDLEGGQEVAEIPDGMGVLFRKSVQPYLISWFRYDPAKEIGKLGSTRVLIVQGSTDIQCTVEDADLLAKGLDSAQKVVIPEMNHVLKKVAENTMAGQQAHYTDPTIPLHPEFITPVTEFLCKN